MALALLGTTAACASPGGSSEATSDGSGLTEIDVALIPIVQVAPVMLALEKGYFEEEGLKVNTRMINEGPAIVPAVVSGDVDLGFAGTPSLIKAGDQGLDVRIVAGAEKGPSTPEEDLSRLMVQCDGPIKTAADLEGHKVAVGALGGTGELTPRAALANAGADLSKISLVEVPFSSQPQALESGEVSAIYAGEPFSTIAEEQGACTLMPVYLSVGPDLPLAVYFANNSFIESNPEAIAGFVRALERGVADAKTNPDEVIAIVPSYTELNEDTLKTMPMPVYPDRAFTPQELGDFAELMKVHSDYTGGSDVSDLLWLP